MEAGTEPLTVAVLTGWDEFKKLDWQQIYGNMLKPAFLFDGRRLFEGKSEKKKIGFKFYTIGS